VDLHEVVWHGSPLGGASQILVPTIGESWFNADELGSAAVARHGITGVECASCRLWRWMPLSFDLLPPLRISPSLGDVDIVASPEWFGDGWKAFRQVLVRRGLAEMIAGASPKDFAVNEVR
jgi:hypothetical protein